MALPMDAKHGPGFSTISWRGERHFFTPTQAAIIKTLWEALANDTPEVHAAILLEVAGSQMAQTRIAPLFCRHPAWKTLIVRGSRRGTYRLNDELAAAVPVPTDVYV